MVKQQIIASGEGLSYDWANDHIFVKTAASFTTGQVTVVEDTLKVGFHLARHYHKKMTEIFYILEGEIVFAFDDETIHATPGMTLNIPPTTWHDVRCPAGGKLITIFTPGGFDGYLAELAALPPAQMANEAYLLALSEKYDTWLS